MGTVASVNAGKGKVKINAKDFLSFIPKLFTKAAHGMSFLAGLIKKAPISHRINHDFNHDLNHEAIPLPCLNPWEHSTLATHENAVITSQAINSKRKL